MEIDYKRQLTREMNKFMGKQADQESDVTSFTTGGKALRSGMQSLDKFEPPTGTMQEDLNDRSLGAINFHTG